MRGPTEGLIQRGAGWALRAAGGTVIVDPDTGAIDFTPAAGQPVTVNGDFDVTGSITGTVNVDQLQLEDDEQLQFGDAPNYWWHYDSGNTRLALRSADVDGVPNAGDILRVVDGGQVVAFPGGVQFDDSVTAAFGTGSDATITYDGTNLVVDPQAVGGGDVQISNGQLLLPDGSAGAPAVAFANETDTGWWWSGSNDARLAVGGSTTLRSTSGVVLVDNSTIFRATGRIDIGDSDLQLHRDAADTLAQRRGTNAQEQRWYGKYDSATDYHRSAIKVASSSQTSVTGASVTASGLIPAGAVLIGLTTRIETGLGTGNGTTGYNVGDGSDADRWGAVSATAAGNGSHNADWTSGTVEAFTAAQDVVLTAVGGNFDGTGDIDIYAFYLLGEFD